MGAGCSARFPPVGPRDGSRHCARRDRGRGDLAWRGQGKHPRRAAPSSLGQPAPLRTPAGAGDLAGSTDSGAGEEDQSQGGRPPPDVILRCEVASKAQVSARLPCLQGRAPLQSVGRSSARRCAAPPPANQPAGHA